MNRRNLEPTPILDYDSAIVSRFAESVRPVDNTDLSFLRALHAAVSEQIRPIYTVNERQPVSQTISLLRGSCSQRLACLEAISRRRGIGTRVRALWVSGSFWNSRFPLTRLFIPERILLAWPQFSIDDGWLGIEEIFGPLEDRAGNAGPFANDAETLFEAVRSTAVDFDGRTRTCSSVCDLSRFVVENASIFDKRDDLFAQLGSLDDTWRGRAFKWLYEGRSSA
jgi:hypothetical protein